MKTEQQQQDITYYLDIKNTKNNAIADGKTENKFEISCWDSDFYPARGIDIFCHVDGQANIKQSGRSYYHGYTDSGGMLSIGLVNTVDEEVTLTVEVFNETGTRQEFTSNFISNSGKLAITGVVNVNQTFQSAGEPSIAWPGAEFLIKVKGGSGEMYWQAENTSSEVSTDSTPDGNGRVVIRNRPRQVCRIVGRDLITGETVTYDFQITTFVTTDNVWRNAYSNQGHFGDNRLRVDECQMLYRQWGNLGSYPVWDIDTDYWTNDMGFFSTTCFNFRNGNMPWINNLDHRFSIYKLGSY